MHIAGTSICIVVPSQASNTNYVAAPDKEHTMTINQAATATKVTCGANPFTYTSSEITPCSPSVTGPGGLNRALTEWIDPALV